jgi:hypothetical protein
MFLSQPSGMECDGDVPSHCVSRWLLFAEVTGPLLGACFELGDRAPKSQGPRKGQPGPSSQLRAPSSELVLDGAFIQHQ